MKKTLKYFIVFLMLFSVFIPISGSENPTGIESTVNDSINDGENESTDISTPFEIQSNGKDLGDIFDSIVFKIGDTEVTEDVVIDLVDGRKMSLSFEWSLSDDVELADGDWAIIKVPEVFKPLDLGAEGVPLYQGEDIVGHFTVDEDGFLKIVFNNKLAGQINRTGDAGFEIELNLTEFEDENQTTIKWDEQVKKEDITIRVKPATRQDSINKIGNPNSPVNPTHINWTIDVNRDFQKLTAAQVRDTLPAGVELDGEILVQEIIYGLDLGGNLVEKKIGKTFNATEFPVVLGEIETAYRLSFSTKITDYSKDSYNNIAELYDGDENIDDDNALVEGIEYGSMIEKSGQPNKSPDTTLITWTIDFNKAQMNIEDASLDDEIPDGLSLKENSIKIYELDFLNNNWVQGNEVTSAFTTTGFPIEFGDIDGEAYRVVYETDVDPSWFVGVDENGKEEFIYEKTFINEAILYSGESKIDSDNDQVDVDRSELVGKQGKEVTSYGDTFPVYEWTITVNKANQPIWFPFVEDKLGPGLTMVDGSVTISPEIEGAFVNYTDTLDGFSVALGNYIDSEYTITYRTVVDASNAENETFTNNYTLYGYLINPDPEGTGVGPGERTPIETDRGTATPSIFNTYSKSRIWNFTAPNGVVYNAVDNAAKTMSWHLEIDAIREEITALTITDTFVPDKSMVFLKDTLLVYKDYDSSGRTLLEEGTHYDLIDNGVDGFVLTFKAAGLDRTKYDIVYKTSFDPDVVEAEEGDLNTKNNYKNVANFDVITKKADGTSRDLEKHRREAEYPIPDFMFNNGDKKGTLDREGRKVAWTLYVNAMSQELPEGFVVRDTLTRGEDIDTNQVFNRESLKAYEFSVNADGVPTKGEEITIGDDAVVWKDQSFTITFADGLDHPVMFEFESDIVGISQANYENKANVTYKKVERTYQADVNYENHNDFIQKDNLIFDNETRIFVDDQIEWKIVLNRSLSEIENAEFHDTITGGHVYLKGSLTVNDEPVDPDKLTVNHGGNPTLIVELGDIEGVVTIKYTTVVTGEIGQKIKNSAKLVGKGIPEEDSTSDKEYDISQKPGGTGSGTRTGSITITKVDAETGEVISSNPATFELYYMLNGDPKVVTALSNETNDGGENGGKLVYGRLPLRTYYLRETESPEGYVLDETAEDIAITIAHGKTQHVEIEVSNTKEKIDVNVTKEWVGTPPHGHPTEISVQLKQGDTAFGYPVKLNAANNWEHTWKDLDRTNINGEAHVYTVEEVDVPEYYDVHTEVVENSHKLTNTYSPVAFDWEFEATKNLVGRPTDRPLLADEFNFELVDKTSNPEKLLATGTNDADGNIKFTPVELVAAGIYNFVVREVSGLDDNITYDLVEKNVRVVVTDNNGYLSATVTSQDVVFENVYTPHPVVVQLGATKNLINRPTDRPLLAREFSFELVDKSTDPETIIETVSNDAEGKVVFSSMTIKKAGTYNYVVREVIPEDDELDSNITYDENERTIVVEVVDDNGQLVATVTSQDVVFENVYTPHPTNLELEVTKELIVSGRRDPEVNGRDLEEGDYSFVVVDAADKVVATATNLADGTVSFSVENYFTEVGEYKLTIREVIGEDTTINYATNEITATVTVTDNNGQLVAAVSYDVEDPTFTNVEKTYAVGDFTWIDEDNQNGLQDDKEVLEGVIVELYEITEDGRKLIDSTTTDKEGLYLFDELVAGRYQIRFVLTEDQAKEYEFTKNLEGDDSTNDSDAHPLTGWTEEFTLDDSNKYLTKEYEDQEFLATQGVDPTWDAGVILRSRTEVSVAKEWVGVPEDSVTVTLNRQAKGSDVKEALGEVVLNKENDWTHTWTNLYVDFVTEEGKVNYVYTVQEKELDRYLKVITGDSTEGFVITNTRKTYAIGDFTWIDSNRDGIQDEKEPVLEGVIVELFDEEGKKIAETKTDENGRYLFDELEAGTYKVRFTLTPEQKEIYEFTQQVTGDKSVDNSDADVYTGWTVEIKLNDDNQHLTPNEKYEHGEVKATMGIDPTWDAGVVLRERMDITVEKVWNGGPVNRESVLVQLYRNDEKFGDLVKLDDTNDWEYTWTNLYITDENRVEYEYTVVEVELDGYTAKITGDSKEGFVITNTYASPLMDVVAHKIWSGAPAVKPTIQFQLFQNGLPYGDPVTLVNGVTSYTWTNVEINDFNGKAYVYTVDEVKVPENYEKKISEDGLTITNTYVDSLPGTGVESNSYGVLGTTMFVLGLGILIAVKKKKNSTDSI